MCFLFVSVNIYHSFNYQVNLIEKLDFTRTVINGSLRSPSTQFTKVCVLSVIAPNTPAQGQAKNLSPKWTPAASPHLVASGPSLRGAPSALPTASLSPAEAGLSPGAEGGATGGSRPFKETWRSLWRPEPLSSCPPPHLSLFV